MMPLKKVVSTAVKNRWLVYNPFNDYKISLKETNVEYLDKNEVKAIMDVKLDRKLEVVRDLFLFCTFTGLSYCDMRNRNIQVFIGIRLKLSFHKPFINLSYMKVF